MGEILEGKTSGTLAIFTEQLSDSQISCIPVNESEFIEGESVFCESSNIQAVINTGDVPSRNISADFTCFNPKLEPAPNGELSKSVILSKPL